MDTIKAIESVHALKRSFYDLATNFVELKGIKHVEGLKFKDFCTSRAFIDPTFVDFCIKLMEKVPELESFNYTIRQLKDIVSEKKEEKEPNSRYLTIKLNQEQEKIFKLALEKFCLEHGIDQTNASSFFVETRCAEYLAEVDVQED